MPTEQRKKVLIVDDDRLMRGILRRNVVLAGYEALLASTGAEALQKIREEIPDLIVVDLVMPDMNGFETCRQIRDNQSTKKTPVIVVSGLQGETDNEKAIASGADVFMTKPVNNEEFIKVVKRFLPSPFKMTP
ncbi:MAG TPA: response regulator [Bacteroidota bacterium]|nr:response regulator [Bacteroidota bacterium]